MKYLILTAIIIIFMLPCNALYSGETYELLNDKCYGNATLKIRSDIQTNDYDFIGTTCYKINNSFWNCDCLPDLEICDDTHPYIKCHNQSQKTNILFKPYNNTVNEYDIVLQYYINSIKDDNSKRVLNFNNINVTTKEYKEPFVWPDASKIGIVLIIVFILLIIFGIFVFMVLRYILTDNEDKSFRKAEKRWKEQERIKKMEDDIKKNL